MINLMIKTQIRKLNVNVYYLYNLTIDLFLKSGNGFIQFLYIRSSRSLLLSTIGVTLGGEDEVTLTPQLIKTTNLECALGHCILVLSILGHSFANVLHTFSNLLGE